MEGSHSNSQVSIIIQEDGKEDDQTQGQEDNALKRNDRKRTSKVWKEFTIITVGDGSKKAKCSYCSTLIAINSQGSTTQFHRHLDSCPVRLASTKKQRLLTTQPLSPTDFGGVSGGTLTTYRDVFPRYKERDPSYLWLPSSEDWDRELEVCKFLEAFNDATHIFSVLDPRYKMKLIEFYYSKIYPSFKAREEIESVLFSLHELYVEYVANYATNNVNPSDQARGSFPTKNNSSSRIKSKTKGRAEFDLWAQELDTIVPIKSDLDIYLEEASDILSIPITTVASESAFSAGERVLDQYRSSLKPETVQALVCTGDWLLSE
ncbi:hypothetical protein BUALT_Bualt02G0157200 [Buddleja alternifolia]|uniref:BED-type domain-containing protein n=1 Tax=Buddleja alternifolia TaxID=168488 RepID=A0AAV6Y4R7_9LAMI|nr:hypothetical protein BUALT_Bualt02G0157200 [Buddleja alternifolia]